jgi:hypothetical protein
MAHRLDTRADTRRLREHGTQTVYQVAQARIEAVEGLGRQAGEQPPGDFTVPVGHGLGTLHGQLTADGT